MKKIFALLMALIMVLSTGMGVYALPTAQISPEAQTLAAIRMLQGDTTAGVTPEYLTKPMTRLTAAILVLRLKGLESTALAYQSEDNFPDVANYPWKEGKNIIAYLKANPQLGFKGDSNGNFKPSENMTEQAYYKVLLETLGYRQSTPQQAGDFQWNDTFAFARSKGFQPQGKAVFTVNDLAFATVGALKLNTKGGAKLIDILVDSGKVNKEVAIAYGLYAEQVENFDIASAVALNSRVIEVTLRKAINIANSSVVSVKDASGNAVGVAAAELAPWHKDNKTLLVTLAADTKPGTLYTIFSGSTKANFGGKAKDTEKPKVSKVESIDYNEVRVTFTEAVKLQGAVFELAERYGAKTSLANYAMRYEDRDKIIITTSDQKSSTLYVGTIYNILDYANNIIDKSENNTFVGTGKSTESLRVTAASANDFNEICVQFNVNIDPAYLSPSAFKIEETYGTKASVAVTGVRLATEDDMGIFNAALDATSVKKHVILNVAPLKSATLYRVSVESLRTLYGKDLSSSSSDRSVTFVGQSKPSTSFKINSISTLSNTRVKIIFERKVDPNKALNVSNYIIHEAYMNKLPLAVYAAEVKGAEVTLTVASMKNALYKLEVNNLADVYGNNINTSDSANQSTFVGKAVADKIKSIKRIERVSENTIRVEFDQNLGSNATDVSLYYINNEIGYPEKAVLADSTVADYTAKVELTIPKTVSGKIYKLTVKNLANSDEIYMAASDEVSKTFVGDGISSSKAKIEGIYAVDNQTLRIYFDRNVMENTIKGKVWSGTRTPGNLYANALKVSTNGDNTPEYDLDSNSLDTTRGEDHTAYQDPYEENVLIVRLSVKKFRDNQSTASSRTFRLVANSSIVYSDSGANILEFPYNNTDPYMPEMINVYAENSRSLMVYFNEPVTMVSAPTDFVIYNSESGATGIFNSGNQIRVIGAYKVPNTLQVNKEYSAQWKLILDRDLLPTSTNVPSSRIVYLYLPARSPHATDLSTFVPLKPNTDRSYISNQFAVSDRAPDNTKAVVEAIYMPNKRTIDVYYSKDMNPNDVKNIVNYQIVSNSNGTVKADNNRLVQVSDYSVSDYKATLYLSEDIQRLTYSGGTAFTKFYLAVKSTVKDATGINYIKAEESSIAFNSGAASGMVMEFAPSTIEVPRPEIAEISALDSRFAIDIRMDQKVRFPSAADNNAKIFTDSSATLTPAEILAAFSITAQFEGTSAQRDVVVGDVSYGTLNGEHDKLTVVFNRKLAAKSSGTVSTKAAAPDKIKNKQGISAANSGSSVSEGVFGVADSLFGDSEAPRLTEVSIASNNGNIRYAKVGDIVSLNFTANENIQTPAVTIAGNAADVSGGGTEFTAAYAMRQEDAEGSIHFLIQYRDLSGYPGVAVNATLNGSSVIFDKTAPIITGVANGGVYGAEGVTPTFNEGTGMLNGANFTSGTKLTADGDYTLIVADAAGNTSQVSFSIVVPVQLTSVTIAADNNKESIKVEDEVKLSFTPGKTIQMPIVEIAGHAVPVSKEGSVYTASYTMKNTDPEGEVAFKIDYKEKATAPIKSVTMTTDSSKITFDKTAPVISNVETNRVYNATGVAPTFNEGTATLNGNVFTSGTKVTREGNYSLKVVDTAGNMSEASFSIDATHPTVTGVANGARYRDPVTPIFTEGTATLDNAPFVSGTTITEKGTHTLIVADAVGNTNTIRFVIETTAFGVKSAVMHDNYTGVQGLQDFGKDNLGQDGIVDTIVITFTEAIEYTPQTAEWKVNMGTNYAQLAGEAEKLVAISDDKIIINFFKQDQKVNTGADFTQNGFEVVYQPDEINKIKNLKGEALHDSLGAAGDQSIIFENNQRYLEESRIYTIVDGARPIIVSYNVESNQGSAPNSLTILVSEALYYKRNERLYSLAATNDRVFSIDKTKTDGTGLKADFNIDRIQDATKITGHINTDVNDKSTAVSVRTQSTLFDKAGNAMLIRWISDL